jgi:3-methyladenine DNA glycosylase AlkD
MTVRRKLIREIRQHLKEAGDPDRARGQQAYMKSTMPYYGVRTPELRRRVRALIRKGALRDQPFVDAGDLRDTVLALWHGAKFREERLAAIELCEARAHDSLQTLELLPMYEEMITTGAWWDLVDPLAGHRLRRLLEKYPRQMSRRMRQWSTAKLAHPESRDQSRDPAVWKRRSAILCQLARKNETDLALLYDVIEPSLDNPEFFLRKAIGWALRHHSWTDPDEIERYVEQHRDRLSALSKREATRNLDIARKRLQAQRPTEKKR